MEGEKNLDLGDIGFGSKNPGMGMGYWSELPEREREGDMHA